MDSIKICTLAQFPAIYHCVARVVDRRFAFDAEDKEQFRIYMRMMENFPGCRVLVYCVMSNRDRDLAVPADLTSSAGT